MVSFSESVNICLTKKYASFSGRAKRSEMWWFTLFVALVSVLARLYDGNINKSDSEIGVLEAVVTLALIIPSITVYVRRLHDLSLSGAYSLIIIGWYLLFEFYPNNSFIVILIIPVIIFYIYTLFAIGHEKDNLFGENPYT